MVYFLLAAVAIYALAFNIITLGVIKLLNKRIDILEESLKDECDFIDEVYDSIKDTLALNAKFLTSVMGKLEIEHDDCK